MTFQYTFLLYFIHNASYDRFETYSNGSVRNVCFKSYCFFNMSSPLNEDE